jgi:phosphomannomutase
MVDLLVERRGGSVHVVPPGELHLLEALDATGAELAGEGNGGVVVPEAVRARDGLAAAASVLQLLARSGEPLSAHVAALPRLARRRSTVPCPDGGAARALLAGLADAVGQAAAHPESGIRLERPDGSWALVRQSATEPVLRMTVEGPSEEAAEALHLELEAALAGTRA